jgi:hypothetical protein
MAVKIKQAIHLQNKVSFVDFYLSLLPLTYHTLKNWYKDLK